ncbi:MAG: histidine kinase [Bryobacterales bacterium]|nr:histidine kinase [Bryobacterales bacterium]
MDPSRYGLEVVRKDEEFVLRREHSNQPGSSSVLLVVPVSTRPAVATLRKLEHEYSLRDELDSAWAVRPLAIAEHHGRPVLVLDDPGGESLDQLLAGPMEMTQFLRLAVGLAMALSGLHKRGLIHKDVKPANVLVAPATGEVRLMGFGIASRLPRERQAPAPLELIAGTFPYMAPEQTGRMNRSIDSRSDLYSLGVTLYEMLTGTLPLNASDPMEWVHCHIARQPVPPCEKLNAVPATVSAIIMKLLAKTPEERYQTAAGAASDLRRCLDEWQTRHHIDEFRLGTHDTPDRLLVPEKLYGRESEVATLVAAFDRIVAGGRPELVLVSGYSGIGKSSVVNELHKSLVPPRGLFASGKFDQYKRDIPYATLAQAFHGLLRPLLAKNEAELSEWRDAIREALGPNGRLMLELVPELTLIIGEQPPVPELPPQDAQRRFQLVFRRFLGVFARPEHPLVLFLDDLQWLDSAALEVLEDLLTHADVQHLLIIGAYRDNEVDAAHPLARKIEGIRELGASIHEIKLAPLSEQDVMQLITHSLQCQPEGVLPLAQSVHSRTAGNPFFVIQFLSALEHERLLVFDHARGRWSWDLAGIHAKNYTDNVADLVVGKLRRLPSETQEALLQFACLGNVARVTTLSLVYGTDEAQLHSDLFEAIRAEMVERQQGFYKFIHDRVQEAAYSLIPERLRSEAHLRIGRLLLAHTPPGEREEMIFEIVNQLNRGAGLISSREEREELAGLNLIAGQRAKLSAAYASALTYLAAGAELLPEDGWDRRHDLAFALELNRAECEYMTAQLGPAEERLTALAARAATLVERAAVAALRVDLYTTIDESDRAITVGLEYLRQLGVNWSAHPSNEEVRREYEEIWSQLGTRAIEDLIELPILNDPASLATLDILTKLATPGFILDRNLHALANCRTVNLSLELGNCDASCPAYVSVAIIAGARFGDYQAGYRFGRLGCELAEQRGWKRFQPRTNSFFGALVMPCTRPFKSSRDLLCRAIEDANRIGDVVFAIGIRPTLCANMLAAGDHLVDVEREAERGLEFAEKARFGQVVGTIAAQLGLVRTLRGLTRQFGRFDDEQFEELAAERRFASNPSLQLAECMYWIRKMQARFLAGDVSAALHASQQAERLQLTSESILDEAEYHFYTALSRAACCDSISADDCPPHLEALASHQRQIEILAQNCPENFGNRAALVAAEIARIERRELDAEHLYERAIRSAHASGFVHNEALAYELAARFYKARGFDKFADSYLIEARYCYQRWGADGKVKQLNHLYPHLEMEGPVSTATSTIVAPAELLDLATVIKVSQAVSGEMVLENLIDRIMRAAVEYAGAERGVLILPRGDELKAQAEATISGNDVTVHLRDAPLAGTDSPESLIRYVTRTQESVILDDASSRNTFSADPYLVQHRVRSALCLPLINQAKLIGVLYLENNLTPHVFTRERTTVLKVFASQAAISLEKTRLYHDLEDREAKIRRLVDANILGIMIWNVEGAIVASNEAFLELVQYDREDLAAGRLRWTDLTPAEWREADEHALRKLKETGTVQPYEKELFRKDGSRVPVLIAGAMFEENGSDGVAFALDLSEQKRAEAEIRALRDQLYKENLVLREEVDRTSMFEEIVGTSKPLKAILSRTAKVAPTDSTVFITGETGTGKELIARAVHKRSRRSERPFVSVNCAALAPSLIASELFGHEKGAFTGAIQRRLGRFELADGGTIFLDEVGDFPPDTQVALLRILQEREFERVGGTQSIKVNVRVIAATNRDLKLAVANDSFRQDLFYRLNVFPIEVPPLRERKDDILMLVEYFVQRYADRAGKKIRSIDKKTLDLLQAYQWPGNIRELQNIIERSVILSSSEFLFVDESWFATEVPPPAPRVEAPEGFTGEGDPRSEREIIEAALAESRGRVSGPSGAAAKLGIPQSTLAYKIKVLGINKSRFRFR